MVERLWYGSVETIRPHLVRIATPDGRGSGFLLHSDSEKGLCLIATATHVVSHAHNWEQPIRIDYDGCDQPLLLHHGERAVFLDERRDTAGILISNESLPLPSSALPLLDHGKHMRVGVEIGWLGYPAIPRAPLCFFFERLNRRCFCVGRE